MKTFWFFVDQRILKISAHQSNPCHQCSLFTFRFSPMDTDDLSNETYEAIIIEAERFHHNLTLHFGLLADDCDTEEEYLDAAEKLVKNLMKAKPNHIKDFLFGEVKDLSTLPATLEKMLASIARVREIPEEKRTYEF